jgi:hypothetical protein
MDINSCKFCPSGQSDHFAQYELIRLGEDLYIKSKTSWIESSITPCHFFIEIKTKQNKVLLVIVELHLFWIIFFEKKVLLRVDGQ